MRKMLSGFAFFALLSTTVPGQEPFRGRLLATGPDPHRIAGGDLDGDGFVDLVTGHEGVQVPISKRQRQLDTLRNTAAVGLIDRNAVDYRLDVVADGGRQCWDVVQRMCPSINTDADQA